jgi:hypothetical protein
MSVHRRLLLAAATAILGLALAAPAALAATTVDVERSVDVHFDAIAFGASVECGFTIEIHTVGKGLMISRYQDGRLVSQTIQFVWTGYLLNPANGRTVDSKVAGPSGSRTWPTARSSTPRWARRTGTSRAPAW